MRVLMPLRHLTLPLPALHERHGFTEAKRMSLRMA